MFVKRKHLWITASFDPENKNIHLVIAIFKLSWKENILIPNVKQNVENFHTHKKFKRRILNHRKLKNSKAWKLRLYKTGYWFLTTAYQCHAT